MNENVYVLILLVTVPAVAFTLLELALLFGRWRRRRSAAAPAAPAKPTEPADPADPACPVDVAFSELQRTLDNMVATIDSAAPMMPVLDQLAGSFRYTASSVMRTSVQPQQAPAPPATPEATPAPAPPATPEATPAPAPARTRHDRNIVLRR